MSIEFMASLATVLGTAVAAVNIIVEVLKSFWIKKEEGIPLVVTAVSLVMSIIVVYAYCAIESVVFTPLLAMGALVGGFFIAYGAMFGYDNLYGGIIKQIENLLRGDTND